jgi:hypothetical protein
MSPKRLPVLSIDLYAFDERILIADALIDQSKQKDRRRQPPLTLADCSGGANRSDDRRFLLRRIFWATG